MVWGGIPPPKKNIPQFIWLVHIFTSQETIQPSFIIIRRIVKELWITDFGRTYGQTEGQG